jgi:hypothetical protein
MARERRLHRGGQHRHAVLVALAAAYQDLVAREVDVLHAQAAALEHPEPRAIEQVRHQPGRAVKPLEKGPDLVAGEDDGQPLRPSGTHDVVQPWDLEVQDLPIEKQQGAQRLVLGGRGNVAIDGQPAQEAGELRCPHLGGANRARRLRGAVRAQRWRRRGS